MSIRLTATARLLAVALLMTSAAAPALAAGHVQRVQALGGAASCTASLAGDSCSASDLTQTSVTETFTFTVVRPLCDSHAEPCTNSVFISGGADGPPPQPTSAWNCPQGTWNNTSRNAVVTQSTYTCSVHWDWSASARPTTGLNTNVNELDGFSNTNSDGAHGFHVNIGAGVQAPVTSFTATTVDADTGSYRFTATSTDPAGLPLTHAWTSSDGGSGTGQTYDHVFTTDGTATVTLTSTNSGGASSTVSQAVEVALAKGGITGTILRGKAPHRPDTPPVPAQGVLVTAKGKTTAGKTFAGSATSDLAGGWRIVAPSGAYTVSFPTDVCASVPGTGCVYSTPVAVAGSQAQVVDAVALASDLAVTVTSRPAKVELKKDPKSGQISPTDVTITVTVKNIGQSPVSSVTVTDQLVVGYHNPLDVNVPAVPLRPKKGPNPNARIGTLQPGKSARVTYVLTANGDGSYDVDALALGLQNGVGRIVGRGTTVLTIGSPVLEITTSMGRKTTRKGGLIKAGSPFTIKIKLTNLSYVKKIAVEPTNLKLAGNAYDGHIESAGYDIGEVSAVSAVRPSEWIALEPRRSVTLEGYVRTTSIPADVVSTGETVGAGGTRARVSVTEPVVHLVSRGDVLGEVISGNAVNIVGPTTFELGIDDSDFRTPPPAFSYAAAYAYFSVGQLQGLWNVTAGAVKGLVDLPVLLGKGIAYIPTAHLGYMRMEVELWDAIRNDPVLVAAYMNVVTNQVLLAYRQAPFVAKKTSEIYAEVNKQVFAHYEKMWNDYYSGDWRSAMREFGREGTERAADVALAVGPGILSRMPEVKTAFLALKERTYAAVSEDLAAYAPRLLSAIEAPGVMQRLLKPGLEMTDTVLRGMFGITQREADFLRAFARDNKLLLVVRSRAAESVKWIKAYGAVLKPEAMKLKNVSFTDWKWLGYPQKEIGRVVIKAKNTLPTEEELIAKLVKAGRNADDPEYVEALDRLKTRLAEFDKDADGYVKQLEAIAKPTPPATEGSLTLNWNFADNGVDASHYTDVPMTYSFRIRAAGKGLRIPEVKVGTLWRSFTGDIDFLQITHANGAPLLDAERVGIYRKLAKSVTGLLHPESATWTMLKDNRFNFPQKVNEFVRGGICAQFGPDGVSRAVRFVNDGRSYFHSKYRYRIEWEGGYSTPLGRQP